MQKSKEFIAVSITDTSLKVAQVKTDGQNASVSKVACQAFTSATEPDKIKTIQSTLSKFKKSACPLCYVIPPGMAITKNIEVPSTDPAEIKSIVSLQAGRHTPFSRDEIQVGYINIGVFKTNFTKILLVIANKNKLKEHMSLLERAGAKVKKVLFASEATASFYSTAMASAGVQMFIDVDHRSTEVIIVQNKTAISTRNIPIGRAQLAAEKDEASNKLVEELKNTLDEYNTEDIGEAPAGYTLCGEGPVVQALQGSIQQTLAWEVKAVSCLQMGKFSKPATQVVMDHPNESLVGVVASAAMAGTVQVDLLPDEMVLQKSIESQSREIFKAAITGFLIIISLTCVFGVRLHYKQQYLAKIESDYASVKDQVELLEQQSNRIKFLKDYLNERMDSLETIRELSTTIPKEVYLTTVTMNEQGDITIQGISEIASIVFNLGTGLKEAAAFKSVDIRSTTSKKDRGKDVSSFEIGLRLASAPDVEPVMDQNSTDNPDDQGE